jgi:hypothetical protein
MLTEPGQHLPDGIWKPGATGAPPIAIEVERSGKVATRWNSIASDLLSRYQHVHYWLSTTTSPAWVRWATENLIAEDRARIVTYELEARGVNR